MPSGTTTPRTEPDNRHHGTTASNGSGQLHVDKRSSVKKVAVVDYDSDIDPDDLLPVYIDCKSKLFQLNQTQHSKAATNIGKQKTQTSSRFQPPVDTPESAKLLRKIKKIEDDVLFDQYLAYQQWEKKRIELERDAAVDRVAAERSLDESVNQELDSVEDDEDEVSREAAKLGTALLEENDSDDDGALAD